MSDDEIYELFGQTLISLDSDVKVAFPTSDAVNKALRKQMKHGETAAKERSEAA